MLTKEPEMLQTDAFCEHTSHNAAKYNCGRGFALNNATGGVTARLPQILLVLRDRFVALRREWTWKKGGQEGSWESNGDVDSDTKLLSNCLNRELIGGGGGGVEP